MSQVNEITMRFQKASLKYLECYGADGLCRTDMAAKSRFSSCEARANLEQKVTGLPT